jgi:hypothetical protein
LTAGENFLCALRSDGRAVCWEGEYGTGLMNPPEERFQSIAAGGAYACGLKPDGAISCWGTKNNWAITWGYDEPPKGTFIELADQCALKPDRAVQCWGLVCTDGGWKPAWAPAGEFLSLAGGHSRACGLRPGGGLTCWADLAEVPAPSGSFISVSVGTSNCAVRTDLTAVCWDSSRHVESELDVPDGTYLSTAGGDGNNCGIKTDGTLVCWGLTASWQTPVPAGQFASIAGHGKHPCGIRTDGTIACWGLDGASLLARRPEN